jgi:hypothetical protein
MRRGIAVIGTVVMLAFAASALLFTLAAPAFADDIIPTTNPVDPPVDPPPVDDPVDDIIDEVDDIVDEVGDVVDGVGDAIDSGTGGGGSDGGGSDGGGSDGGGSDGGGSDGGAGDGSTGGGGGSDGGSGGGSGDGKGGGGKGGGGKGGGGGGKGGPIAWSWTVPTYQMRNFDTRLVYRPFTDAVTSSSDTSDATSGGGAAEAPAEDIVEAELASDSSAAPGARHVWLLLPLAVLALACVAFAVFESEPPSGDRA